jgi:hypothetical protein
LEIKEPSLARLEGASSNGENCTQIGDIGEQMVSDLLTEHGIMHKMMKVHCPVDIIIPTYGCTYGVEIKTSLTLYHRVVLGYIRGWKSKIKYCRNNRFIPITILVKKSNENNGSFNILWKKGIKRFQIDKMKGFETFLEDYIPPRIDFKPATKRCKNCGKFITIKLGDAHEFTPAPIYWFIPREVMDRQIVKNRFNRPLAIGVKINLQTYQSNCKCKREKKFWVVVR